MLNPLTTATSIGVAIRYAATIVGTVITIGGVLNWLTPQQVDELSRQVPELFAALTALLTLLIPLYAIVTKSSSDKAAEAAKEIDKQIPPSQDVVIQTPVGQPDIVVPAAPKSGG